MRLPQDLLGSDVAQRAIWSRGLLRGTPMIVRNAALPANPALRVMLQ